MNIWIITTGSSDVQVNTQDNWERLRGNVRSQLETGKQFSESKFPNRKQWLYPARAVGVVYGTAIEKEPKFYYDLVFPLLDNFFWILEGKDDEVEKVDEELKSTGIGSKSDAGYAETPGATPAYDAMTDLSVGVKKDSGKPEQAGTDYKKVADISEEENPFPQDDAMAGNDKDAEIAELKARIAELEGGNDSEEETPMDDMQGGDEMGMDDMDMDSEMGDDSNGE